jgi:anti-sigma regulatory factor (Ser/Thr protein kinase)
VNAGVSTVFPAVAPSASGARRFVASALRRAGVAPDQIALATLLSSELVTNAYVHASSDTRVTVHADGQVVRIEVFDLGAGGVELLSPSPEETFGRGLQIVDALADRWGHDSGPEGNRVWFELVRSSERGDVGFAGRRPGGRRARSVRQRAG